MTLWAILVVGLLDNVLRPALLASGTQMHPLVTMLSVLGGVTAFGPIGILLGPIIASFLFALLDIYSATFA
jgi:predicted PurR-regulated permease PerM